MLESSLAVCFSDGLDRSKQRTNSRNEAKKKIRKCRNHPSFNYKESLKIRITNRIILAICKYVMWGFTVWNSNNYRIVCIDKPTNICIIISALEIIQLNLFIVVVATVSEGVNGCNLAFGRIKLDFRRAPSIVRISCNSLCILINDSDYITLQVFNEVVGNSIVEKNANTVLVIVEGNKSISVPSFTKNLCSIKCIPASIANG